MKPKLIIAVLFSLLSRSILKPIHPMLQSKHGTAYSSSNTRQSSQVCQKLNNTGFNNQQQLKLRNLANCFGLSQLIRKSQGQTLVPKGPKSTFKIKATIKIPRAQVTSCWFHKLLIFTIKKIPC